MRKKISAILFFIAEISFSQNSSDTNAPVLKFESDTLKIGVVEYGSSQSREMKFTNTGKSPLIISDGKTGDGGTYVTFPKDPIMPGKSGIIKVHFDTRRTGPFKRYADITSNAKPVTVEVVETKKDETGKMQTINTKKIKRTGFYFTGKVLSDPEQTEK